MGDVTATGGRNATTRPIPPRLALAVGMPSTAAPHNWQWSPLTELARLESGHTPSRKCSQYWGGNIPWLGIKDARNHHGGRIHTTREVTNELGISNSSARVLPANTVCLSRTASVGYVVVLDREMATSQDFLNWVCSPNLDPDFLKYLFMAEGSGLLRFSSGAVHQTIYFPEAKAFHICHPSLSQQKRIVSLLDEILDGIAIAAINAEKNLSNARNLFQDHIRTVFSHSISEGSDISKDNESLLIIKPSKLKPVTSAAQPAALNDGKVTKTGGREATLRHIQGNCSLSVGMPNTPAKKGWSWKSLSDLARLESGHTPSKSHSEYWGGDVHWIGIQDARENHGLTILETMRKTNNLGIENSSARVLPKGTVCLSRTASVGYVVVMGKPMATSQDFINWVCTDDLVPDFLKYLFLAEGRDGLLRYASGAVHQTIYFPEAKAFHICLPDAETQLKIVEQCNALRWEVGQLEIAYQKKLDALDELKKSILHHAFSGQLQ